MEAVSAWKTFDSIVGLVLEIIGWVVVMRWALSDVFKRWDKWKAKRGSK